MGFTVFKSESKMFNFVSYVFRLFWEAWNLILKAQVLKKNSMYSYTCYIHWFTDHFLIIFFRTLISFLKQRKMLPKFINIDLKEFFCVFSVCYFKGNICVFLTWVICVIILGLCVELHFFCVLKFQNYTFSWEKTLLKEKVKLRIETSSIQISAVITYNTCFI